MTPDQERPAHVCWTIAGPLSRDDDKSPGTHRQAFLQSERNNGFCCTLLKIKGKKNGRDD